jgi:hypothetical protein
MRVNSHIDRKIIADIRKELDKKILPVGRVFYGGGARRALREDSNIIPCKGGSAKRKFLPLGRNSL